MKRGCPLRIEGEVDDLALKNSEAAQDVLSGWHPGVMSRIAVEVEDLTNGSPATGVGCFFSGGVDSFYSVLTHLDEITHLVFVTGFDIDVSNDELAAEALAGARASAKALGKTLLEVKTDIRVLGEDVLDWGVHFHGAALAAVGLALSDTLGRVIIPSSYHRDDLYPWGSHPDLDPRWSSSRVTFEHDGVDVTRPEKVRAIAQHQVALDHLRVCWENRDNAFNCGRCEKCLRTMINLRSVDALRRCKTLPTRLDISAVRRMKLSHGAALFAGENLRELQGLPDRDRALEKALQRTIRRQRLRAPLGRIKRRVQALRAS